MKEGVEYEIIPSHEDEQAWNVRILEGPFTETIIKYGAIGFKSENMTFNFSIESSPDEDLKIDNEELQEFVGGMLESILAQGIKEGSIITKDIQDNGK